MLRLAVSNTVANLLNDYKTRQRLTNMPFDPENPKDISRLHNAITWSEDKLGKFRETVVEQKREMVGQHYGSDGADDRRPLPILRVAHRVYSRFVTTRSPQATVSVQSRELLPAKFAFQRALNFELTRKKVGKAISKACSEALFRWGSVTIGVDEDDEMFVAPILIQDRLLDMRARQRDEQQYTGHRFAYSYDDACDRSDFDKKARRKLKEMSREQRDDTGRKAEEDAQAVSIGQGIKREGIVDEIDLIQVYLRRERMLLILTDDDIGKPLKVIENWDGPDLENGPYVDVCFGDVVGNLMPMGLMSDIYDLHFLANRLFNKASRQAERQRTNPIIKDGMKDEATTWANLPDGQVFFSSDPEAFKEYRVGGADQSTLAMVMWAKQMAMMLGGNIEALAGMGAQTGTYGQDRLLTEAANETVGDIQADSVEFATEVIRQFAWYMWNDPVVDITTYETIPGTSIQIPYVFNPDVRKGKFFDYDFAFDPFSLRSRSPQERSAQLMQFLHEIVIPLAPAMQQAGMGPDWEFIVKTVSNYAGNPDIVHMLHFTDPQAIPSQAQQGPGMPASTTRNYVRTNHGVGNQGATERSMMQSLMSPGSSQQE